MNAQLRRAFPHADVHPISSALVVDANELHLASLQKTLAQLGVGTVKGMHEGGAGIQALREGDWGVVFVDLDLHDVTGMQLIDVLADRGSNAGLVITSSHSSRILHAASLHAAARGLDVVATLRKPLDTVLVKDVLDDLVLARARALHAPQAADSAMPDFTLDELRQALLSQQIKPYFQPQHDVVTGALRGAELLARWHHPAGKVLGPHVFLPAFERAGMMECLTNYMLSCALDALAKDPHGAGCSLAVNVPAAVACSVQWAQSIADLAKAAGADPAHLIIEITEDGGPACNATLSGAVTQLRLRGFQCAIDDFGTGDSSLDRLMGVPFNEIKINRGMILQAREHVHARSVLASIIAMGRQLVATVVAEGIEDEEDLQMVRNLGC
jgi:EAL domain-containing protein (putative c-di-GMP-specific phosphodiesterase class I)/ActR/RegA family two-component response regulator